MEFFEHNEATNLHQDLNIKHNINQVQQLIAQAEHQAHRKPGSVLLLAVSKQHSAEAILEAYHAGLRDFGESYLQEAEPKIAQLKDFDLTWHFIGPIQSNKLKGIARQFDWVHGINRASVAQGLNEHRPKDLAPLQVCLQINLVEEKSKAGIAPEQAAELAFMVNQMPQLKLRGLMTIPPPQHTPAEQYTLFLQLKELMDQLKKDLEINMDTLSMGMSDDIVPAIQAGSTIVRVGRAIFGDRQGKPS